MQNNIFWTFELEDDGTVLHSNFHTAEAADEVATRMVGRNFFDDIKGFEDVVAFERYFKTFVKSRKAAERLSLKCTSGMANFDASVKMTRAFQTGYCQPTGVVMLEIKNA